MLWADLSVFAGSFELDAIEGIVGSHINPTGHGLLNLIMALVDKSILVRDEHSGGGMRFRMLGPIREYGEQRLQESGQWIMKRRAHLVWYADLVALADAEWIGPRQVDWLDSLRAEYANLQAAMEFCTASPPDAEAGLRIAAGLRHLWNARGPLSEGRRWLARLLGQTSAMNLNRARALQTASWLATLQGDLTAADNHLGELRRLASQLGGHADALMDEAMGLRAMFRADPSAAVENYRKAYAKYQASADLCGQVESLFTLQLAYDLNGDRKCSLNAQRSPRVHRDLRTSR